MTKVSGPVLENIESPLDRNTLPSLPGGTSPDFFVTSEDPLQRVLSGRAHGDPQPKVAIDTTRATADRPPWISEAEAAWFEETGGLQPVAQFADHTVTIKLKKPGISKMQFIEHVSPFVAYQNTATVETSFECRYQGGR